MEWLEEEGVRKELGWVIWEWEECCREMELAWEEHKEMVLAWEVEQTAH